MVQEASEQQKEKEFPGKLLFLFPVVILYHEIVFQIFTAGNLLSLRLFPILFFSLAYGGLAAFLVSLWKRKTRRQQMAAALLLLISVPYIVQFFIYKQFKQFYDVNTMTGGAGDALTSYFSELLRLIFLRGGLLVTLLFLLPFLLFLFRGKQLFYQKPLYRIHPVLPLSLAGVSYLLALALVSVSHVWAPLYGDQYNFQTAVRQFGLLTGMRLDLKNNLFGSPSAFEEPVWLELEAGTAGEPDGGASGMEAATGAAETSAPEETGTAAQEESEAAPAVYEDNVLDLNFSEPVGDGASQIQALNEYVQSLTPSKQNEYTGLFQGKNLILITAEAFSAEVIDPELTPTLYRLATKGIQFTDYYQPASAGTTGGEYQILFGMLPVDGGRSFKNTADHLNYFTLGNQLDRLGYYGKAFHNNSYTYYSRNITHNNLGYSDGFMGYGNGMEAYVQEAWPQSDYEMIRGTLPTYLDQQPFNIYYMTVSGHSDYEPDNNSMTQKNWDRVQDLPYSGTVKGYLAAQLELEDALTYLVDTLEQEGIADDTVICLSSDHFPYGLDSDAPLGQLPYLSELYGYEVDDYWERDHSRLILWCGCLEDQDPIVVDSPTFSLDILPTLSNLFGTEFDSRLMPGRDVFSDATPLIFNTNYDWKTDLGTYYAASGTFVPKDSGTVAPEGYVDAILATVRNKMRYCESVLNTDYFRYLFS